MLYLGCELKRLIPITALSTNFIDSGFLPVQWDADLNLEEENNRLGNIDVFCISKNEISITRYFQRHLTHFVSTVVTFGRYYYNDWSSQLGRIEVILVLIAATVAAVAALTSSLHRSVCWSNTTMSSHDMMDRRHRYLSKLVLRYFAAHTTRWRIHHGRLAVRDKSEEDDIIGEIIWRLLNMIQTSIEILSARHHCAWRKTAEWMRNWSMLTTGDRWDNSINVAK